MLLRKGKMSAGEIAAAFVLSDLVCVLVMAVAILLSSLLIYWYSWVAWKQVKGEN